MTFQIPRPEWVSDSLYAEDENAQFQMYTPEGNAMVVEMLLGVFVAAEGGMLPKGIKTLLREGVAEVARVFPEVHDTEPEWAITDALNAFFDTQGFARVDRDDLF